MPLNSVTKFDEDLERFARDREWTKSISMNLHQFRGHNTEMPWMIWLVIELNRDIMPISIVNKFNEDV